MKNFIVSVIVLFILALAIFYIIRQKKKGIKCIGCPLNGDCPHKNKGCNRPK